MAEDDPHHWSHKPSPALSDVVIENGEFRRKIEELQESLEWTSTTMSVLLEQLAAVTLMILGSPDTHDVAPELEQRAKELAEWLEI